MSIDNIDTTDNIPRFQLFILKDLFTEEKKQLLELFKTDASTNGL